ncbi:FHA domain-containing protein [Spirosoma aerophilum]
MSSAPQDESKFEQLIMDLSQLLTYTIGRSVDNEIVVLNNKVSGYHARLIQCTPIRFVLEDLASKNGSYVNGNRITRKVVDNNDLIQLADTEFTTDTLLSLLKDRPIKSTNIAQPAPFETQSNNKQAVSPLDFCTSFSDLRQVYEQYPKLRRDCRNREKMIRTGSVILSSVVGVSAVLSTGGGALPFIHIMSGAGLSVLVPTLCSTLLSTDEKLEIIDKEYREKYRCPNPDCRDPFGNREWELLAQQKTCRRCQAVWTK